MATNNATNTSNPITVPQGGTGVVTLTNHGVLIGASTGNISSTAAGSSGQVLQSSGASSDPAYSTATYPATTTVSQLLYSSSANTVAGLSSANNGLAVTSSSGVPSILPGPGSTGNILQANAAAAPSFSTATYPSTAGTSGNVLTSDGTNWNSTAPAVPSYAQSTFTPALAFGGASSGITYTTQLGTYVKIGQVCLVSITITLSSKGVSTGVATITGLPFSSINTSNNIQLLPLELKSNITVTNIGSAFLVIPSASTSGNFDTVGITGTQAQLADTNFANTSAFVIQGAYITA